MTATTWIVMDAGVRILNQQWHTTTPTSTSSTTPSPHTSPTPPPQKQHLGVFRLFIYLCRHPSIHTFATFSIAPLRFVITTIVIDTLQPTRDQHSPLNQDGQHDRSSQGRHRLQGGTGTYKACRSRCSPCGACCLSTSPFDQLLARHAALVAHTPHRCVVLHPSHCPSHFTTHSNGPRRRPSPSPHESAAGATKR